MKNSINLIANGKNGIIKKEILKNNYPKVYSALDEIYSKYYINPSEIAINRFMESEYNYSINVDPMDNNDELFLPRITIHKEYPNKAYTFYGEKAIKFEYAQIEATELALKYLETLL